MLQCLTKVEFVLNGHPTVCFELQTIELSQNFMIEYQGQIMSEEHITGHSNMIQSSWLNEYSFDNLPKSILQEDDEDQSIIHPVVDALILSPAGQVSIQKVSLLTFGTVACFLICCAGCIYKSEKFRNCLWEFFRGCGSKLYTCVTSEKYRAMKENKLLKKGMEEQKAKIRENINDLNLLTSLEKSISSNAQRSSLPELSRAVKYEDNSLVPEVEFTNLGAHGGTPWHQLDHVQEQPGITTVELNQIGAGGGRDWRTLQRLGQPTDNSGYRSIKHHKEQTK